MCLQRIVYNQTGAYSGGVQREHLSPPRILKEGNKKGRKREKDERKGGKAKFLKSLPLPYLDISIPNFPVGRR